MKADSNQLIFSTGKSIAIHGGVVGLRLTTGDDDGLHYGWDGEIQTPADEWCDQSRKLSPSECVELADEMLLRWAAFRAKYAKD